MNTSVQFRDVEPLEHLREYVETLVEHILGKFEVHQDFGAHVVVKLVRRRSARHKPVFECELLLKAKANERTIVVKKTDKDFHRSARECVEAAEKILRRDSKIRVSKRRQIRRKFTEMLAPLFEEKLAGC